METVVIIIMAMVCFSFALKLTCHSPAGIIILSVPAALFVAVSEDAASGQSKAQIADWLGQPELMLDMSVWLTIDVAFQLCFCVLFAKSLTSTLSKTECIAMSLCRWLPGLLIFPVLFALLTEFIFTFTGMDFGVIAWSLAAAVLIIFPLLAYVIKWIIPETDIRLEMTFMINLIIAALGVIATVNGRTAATGTNDIEWRAFTGCIIILLAGTICGFYIYKYINSKKISKI